MTDAPTRLTLRDLPLPAKLVLTCFLVTVGQGYFSALVQLHVQHSGRTGDHLPTPGDVVEVFAGKKKANPSEAGLKPASKLERLIMGPVEGSPWNGSGSMAAAFFHKDRDYKKLVKENPGLVQRFVDASIEGWIGYLNGDPSPANALIKKHNPEATDEQNAYSTAKLKEFGIVDSGDAVTLGIGAMTDARMREFFDAMVKAGVTEPTVEIRKSYTTRFVNKKVGLELRPRP